MDKYKHAIVRRRLFILFCLRIYLLLWPFTKRWHSPSPLLLPPPPRLVEAALVVVRRRPVMTTPSSPRPMPASTARLTRLPVLVLPPFHPPPANIDCVLLIF